MADAVGAFEPATGEEAPSALIEAVSRHVGTWAAPLVARLLVRRGVGDPEAAEAFLDPRLARGLPASAAVPGASTAGTLLADAIADGAPVRVGCGPDLEAQVAGAMLAGGIADAGGVVRVDAPAWGVPGRLTLDVDAAAEGSVADAPLDGGCGSALIAVRRAGLPGAVVGEPPGPEPLCLTGLAFYVLMALRATRHARNAGAGPDPRRQLDVAVLGLLASGTALQGAQRVLAAHGLRAFEASRRPVMQALRELGLVERATAGALVTQVLPRLAAAADGGAIAALFATTTVEEARAILATVALREALSPPRSTHAPEVPGGGEADLSLGVLGPRLAGALALLEPHGAGNPRPTFQSRGVRVEGARLVGAPDRPRVRVRLRQDGRTLAGLWAGDPAAVRVGDVVDVVFVPRLDRWQGRDRIVLDLVGFRAAAFHADAQLREKARET